MTADPGPGGVAPGAAREDARCPRCGRSFHCGAHDPRPCACTTLRLSAATLRDLRERHHGCLCLQCLGELARDATEARAAVAAGASAGSTRDGKP